LIATSLSAPAVPCPFGSPESGIVVFADEQKTYLSGRAGDQFSGPRPLKPFDAAIFNRARET
jgi:hypothetical protein